MTKEEIMALSEDELFTKIYDLLDDKSLASNSNFLRLTRYFPSFSLTRVNPNMYVVYYDTCINWPETHVSLKKNKETGKLEHICECRLITGGTIQLAIQRAWLMWKTEEKK